MVDKYTFNPFLMTIVVMIYLYLHLLLFNVLLPLVFFLPFLKQWLKSHMPMSLKKLTPDPVSNRHQCLGKDVKAKLVRISPYTLLLSSVLQFSDFLK